MGQTIVLVTKDALKCSLLPVYGNKYWKTPNIDKLAEKGTVFRNHYTNAPSTSMAVVCMFSGMNAHELERRYYTEVEKFTQTDTIFEILERKGYSTHVFWTEGDCKATYPYTKCYSDNTVFHTIPCDSEGIKRELLKVQNESKQFLWIHLPAYMNGKKYYGSDIEDFDDIVGFIKDTFGDEQLYLSSDHGYLELKKGLVYAEPKFLDTKRVGVYE